MGYSISLNDSDGEAVWVVSPSVGGIVMYSLNGKEHNSKQKAWMSVTYNYSTYYYEHLDEEQGIRWLYDKKAKDTIDRLKEAVEILGTKRDENYWNKTPGNAGYILSVMIEWAKQYPEAVWKGD